MTTSAIVDTVIKTVATNALEDFASKAGSSSSSTSLHESSIFDFAKSLTSGSGGTDLTEQVCSGLGKVAGTAMGGPAGGIIGSLLGKYVLAPISKAANKIQTALIDTIANGIGKLVGNIFGEK